MTISPKMKAAFLYGPEDVRIEETATPLPKSGEVLLRVRSVGICQSDLRVIRGIYKTKYFDFGVDSYGLSGHEWSGEVAMVGEGVDNVKVGQRVVPEIIISCGLCRSCKKGMSNLCINKKNVLRGYAEYAIVPAKNLYLLPDNVGFEEAALTEPIAVCLRTNDIISPRPGDTVLIIGSGPMGLIHLQVSKLSGAAVIVCDLLDERLKTAEKLGADYTVNSTKQDVKDEVLKFTQGYGADAVIVAVGGRKAMETALACVGTGGKVVEFAGSYPAENVELDLNLLHYKEIIITGSYDHLPIHMDRAIRLLEKKAINVKDLITHRVSLDNLHEGIRIASGKTCLKVIVNI